MSEGNRHKGYKTEIESLRAQVLSLTKERDRAYQGSEAQTRDQLAAAKVEVLRDAASHMSIASDYAILWRMADEIEKGEVK